MDASVIVAGAGPTGLMLAGELRLAGVDVIVLDRLRERTGESRGLGFTTRTMEVFDQRGLLHRLGDMGTSNAGHFGGLPVDFGVLDSIHQAAKTVPQSDTETMLEEWARELGADIRRDRDLIALHDHGDHIEVVVRGPGGEEGRLAAHYLVGCDGGRSTVRKAAGFDFPGTAATMEMYLADIKGVDLAPRLIGETYSGGMVMSGPLGDRGVTRIIVCEHGTPPRRRTEPPSYAEVAAAWQRITGIDISHAEHEWVSAFGDATRLATEYRRGRVLLAGDAAHIHLPAGGQGMNTGIQDAVNLGWKLASVVLGTAPEALLDTYHGERHPVGERLMMNTKAQGLLFLTGDEIQPLRDVLKELIHYEEVSRHLAGMVSGLEIRYDVGPGRHPLLGLRMPHLELVGDRRKTSSTELLRAGRGMLLDLEDNAVLRDRAAGWSHRVDLVTAEPHGVPAGSPLADTSAVLVRPDGHVAWAAPGSHHDLPMALERWFGPSRIQQS
ncbi:FAD-dependent monooxygenase [Streptomyces sp. MI02-2A]|uniref:FAD-dependent monooxygenase n=1 Tax=unclassified Streptomyces TaxID=2593676 RepID=UPI00074115F0|nr:MULTISPECIES: FAD-dependent monooxygenase [unclassified Streptomyces]ARO44651.1 monooxygenase [Streptomyces sp.]KUJ38043.1 monooxygenase [Streptomyces sp. NRRL F-5122]MDX3261116.1 FAD-dependent monooxygenase [Streptomyces sp. MI02-2A]REE64588.1 bifunctional hydroxylase/dehydrase [Streptomyces sp. 3212.3]